MPPEIEMGVVVHVRLVEFVPTVRETVFAKPLIGETVIVEDSA